MRAPLSALPGPAATAPTGACARCGAPLPRRPRRGPTTPCAGCAPRGRPWRRNGGRLTAQAWPADLEHLQGFHTTLPLGIDALERRQTLDTTALAFSFPLLDDTVSMDHGQLWGVGATRPKPVLLDLRDREHGARPPRTPSWPAPRAAGRP